MKTSLIDLLKKFKTETGVTLKFSLKPNSNVAIHANGPIMANEASKFMLSNGIHSTISGSSLIVSWCGNII